jgi:hypothetical protein
LTKEQKETLAAKFYSTIEDVFVTKHRDYAEAVFTSISPSSLGRDLDVKELKRILEANKNNTHFKNLLIAEIEKVETIMA